MNGSCGPSAVMVKIVATGHPWAMHTKEMPAIDARVGGGMASDVEAPGCNSKVMGTQVRQVKRLSWV